MLKIAIAGGLTSHQWSSSVSSAWQLLERMTRMALKEAESLSARVQRLVAGAAAKVSAS